MNSDPNFGAGIFEEPRHPANNPESSPATAPAPETAPVSAENKNASSQETEETEESGDTFYIQQERDREKAMLLRRTRESSSQESPENPRSPSNTGKRWSPSNRPSDSNRPPFVKSSRPPAIAPKNEEEPRNEFTASPRPEREEEGFQERRSVPDRRAGIRSDIPVPGAVLLDQRVAILVDVQNMYHSARKLHGRNLSYSKLIQNIVKGRKLIRAIAYLLDREGVDQGAFLEHLSNCGFEVRRKDLIERADGSRKGDWDIGIASDAIALSEKVDVIILVSGDGDFVSLSQLLRTRGVKVEVASFRESTADSLIHAADSFHGLGKDSLY